MSRNKELTDAEVLAATRLKEVFALAGAEVSPTITPIMLEVFMAVALHPDQSASEYIGRVEGEDLQSIVKKLDKLGDKGRNNTEGYKLLDKRPSPHHGNVKLYTLSVKGRAVLKRLLKAQGA